MIMNHDSVLGLSNKIEFRIFAEFKIKIHIQMQNAAVEF